MDSSILLILLAVFIVFGLIKKIFKLVLFCLVLAALYLLYMYGVENGMIPAMMCLMNF